MELSLEDSMLKIFIIGTTAVGKTKLSVALAHKLKGQIISCDSKQLYQYASIMTAKVTQEQAQGIQHHMIDCLALEQNAFNRNKYFKQASKAMKEIQNKKKAAIVVGGTNYYIETLLFNLKKLTESDSESQQKEQVMHTDMKITQQQQKKLDKVKEMSKQQKYQLLLKKDRAIALKTHQNDQKRITQFLERVIITNKPISQTYQQNHSQLRHQNSIVFWVRNSDREELQSMVTKRIYKMLDKDGLTQIFSIFYYIEVYNKVNKKQVEVSKIQEYSGACSSIGVRQFKDLYSQVRQAVNRLFQQCQDLVVKQGKINYHFIHKVILDKFQLLKYSEETLAKCRDELILDTKNYCKRQLTWIRNRMFVNQAERRKHFFVLQLSQQQQQQKLQVLQRFQRQVAQRAFKIIDSIKQKGFGSIQESLKEFTNPNKQESLQEWKKYFCEACNVELNGLMAWNDHIDSKRHRAKQKYYDKKQQREQFIQQQRKLAEQRRLAKEQQKKIEKDDK